MNLKLTAAVVAATLSFGASQVLTASIAHAEGDVAKGEKLTKQRCRTCHELENEKSKPTGPYLVGIYGREAGMASDYTKYSDGLMESGIVWDEVTLDTWLANPKDVVKGTRMNFKLAKEDQRQDVIAFLKTLGN